MAVLLVGHLAVMMAVQMAGTLVLMMADYSVDKRAAQTVVHLVSAMAGL